MAFSLHTMLFALGIVCTVAFFTFDTYMLTSNRTPGPVCLATQTI